MYRLGLDLGTNSIGWCAMHLNNALHPSGILDMGVRIFSDGRKNDGTSNAANRRTHRGQRRNRDRSIQRRTNLLAALAGSGLFPEDIQERRALRDLDPYSLRAGGLDRQLTLHELGRALFHINQHRGFRSNRKLDKDDKESGKIRSAVKELQRRLEQAGARTIGEYLWNRKRKGKGVRVRLCGAGMQKRYDFYPSREMLELEYSLLWDAQSRFHASLTPELKETIGSIIFFQRPLKPVQPGRCLFETGEMRAPQALPVVQEFRILQELANLRVIGGDLSERPLLPEERDLLSAHLMRGNDITFDAMRKKLKLNPLCSFNLDAGVRGKLKGNATAAALAKPKCFGKAWHELGDKERNTIVELLLTEEKEEQVLRVLTEQWGLTGEQAQNVCWASLPQGYSRCGKKALRKILPFMREEYQDYSEACLMAGYDHSLPGTGEIVERLPYYGRVLQRHVAFGTGDPADLEKGSLDRYYGKVTNPTVHIVLNQLRKLVNACIERYGHPRQIVVELGRELKMNGAQRLELIEEQKKNKKRNDARKETLRDNNHKITDDSMKRLRLWEELSGDPLSRCCVYTGTPISIEMLLSDAVEIDHILPFHRTLDNAMANKVICLREANRAKYGKTPWEAFGRTGGTQWEDILSRVRRLPRNKAWRFQESAMERFTDEHDFLDRQLHEMRYASRLAKEYLGHICDPKRDIWVIPGRLTALLRRQLLGEVKNRHDHRNHALDAAIVCVTDRAMLQRVAREAERQESMDTDRLLGDVPPPWPEFREQVLERNRSVFVSHKPNHSLGGPLLKESAYGLEH